MSQIHLLSLASQQAAWLSVRQSAVADNIANANTPGYKPQDVEPFERAVDRAAGGGLMLSSARHFDIGGAGLRRPSLTSKDGWEVAPSGNAVSLESELIKADEVNRAYALNTGIVKSFHRMLMLSVK
jgi:flagellar basal-body rod protein FlgB